MLPLDRKIRIKNIVDELHESDATLIRYMEDLVLLLIQKKVLSQQDVPSIVQRRIVARRKLRAEMDELLKESLYL